MLVKTYVDVEVGVINVNTVGSLLEVEVRDAVLASVVIRRETEFSIWSLSCNELSGCLLRTSTSPQCGDSRVGIDLGSVLVLGLNDHTELVEVDSSSRERVGVSSVRVGMDALDGSHRGQGGDESGTHLENEGLEKRVD
jgi:hypothetical protein